MRDFVDLETNQQRDEDIRQFLIESTENLATLDVDIVKLEKSPDNKKLISSVFRIIHTIKGTCGFFGFDALSATAHVTENILSQVRAGQRLLTPALISLILESVDRIKLLLLHIEAGGNEGGVDCGELIARLEAAHLDCNGAEAAAVPAALPAPTVLAPQAAAKGPAVLLPAAAVPVIAPTVPDTVAPAASTAASFAPTALDRRGDSRASESTIRVDVILLDKLMNLVGELVLARNQLLQDTSSQSAALQKTSQRLNLITSELQAGVMKTRMQPIGVVWNKLPRVVRDLAAQCGKQIRMEMIGVDTELDKTIIEAIRDPLTHIVRNSCDHGFEPALVREGKNKDPEGLLLLRAFHEGGIVNIEISDDGAGIDPIAVKNKALERGLITEEQALLMTDSTARDLIFAPGFSTADKITTISGRGVGMDVVKTNIEKIGGTVEVLQGELCGTTVRIKIPLTLAIIPGLIVSLNGMGGGLKVGSRDERFVVPQANLLELVRLEGAKMCERIQDVHGTPIFHYRGKLLPLIYLRQILGRPAAPAESEAVNIVVLHAEGRHIALVVDEIHDTQEIVVKPLVRQLKSIACYVGATIMGDGLPALILDVAGLARLASLHRVSALSRQEVDRVTTQVEALPTQMLLLFRSGRFDRIAIPLALVARLEEVDTSKIERAANQPVLHYRGEILTLISLSSVLEPGRDHDLLAPETVQVIVFSNGLRSIGVIVDEVIDIVDTAITVRRGAATHGLLGSAIVDSKVTDLLDLHAVVGSAGENWLDTPTTRHQRHRLLLVDASMPSREMISEYLSASGYEVIAANSALEAMITLRQGSVDVVIAAIESRNSDDGAMLKALRKDKQFEHIPILGLVEHGNRLNRQTSEEHTYDARLARSQRDLLLDSIATLVQRRRTQLEEVA